MKLLLIVACLVAVNALPTKRCDYNCVMGLVEHAYHNPVHLDPSTGNVDHSTFGKRDLSDLLGSLTQSIANVGNVLHQTFSTTPEHGSDALSSIIQTGLQPIAGVLNGVLDGLQHSNMVDVQKRGAKEFFNNIGDQLSQTFANLGQAFQTTFQGLAMTASQQGSDLLSQALQGGAMVVANGAQHLAANLAHTDAQKRNAHEFLSGIGDQLNQAFSGLGLSFQSVFEGLSQMAAQQGTDLLSTVLQSAQTSAQKRNLGDLLGDLQTQIEHLGDLFSPFITPDMHHPLNVETRNTADLLNSLQQEFQHLSNLLHGHLHHEEN
ncbi:uncharacterized protein [Argopecten irradians]|uniref:uncharacterized protein n=1 Tax=Argopecten irradians TaxID=31199 RepID=UPI0037225DDA